MSENTSSKISDPVVVCTYGPSGIGKTTDCGYSFPRALFLAAPGALTSVEKVCGYIPDRLAVATIEEATAIIEKVGQSKKYKTVVIDDFSFMAEQTFSALEANPKFKGFALWGRMRDIALEFRDRSRYAGVNVILTCWEQPPKTRENGQAVRGGPQLSGKLPEQIPALCDIVLRSAHDKKRKPWGAVYRCAADPSYIMKDRFHIAAQIDPAPMNIGELLRASGVEIDRLPEIKDQESIVQKISENLTGKVADDMVNANTFYASLLEKGMPAIYAKWTLRDAIDRAVIRRELANKSMSFFDLTPGSLS